jgi:hypothetical protein
MLSPRHVEGTRFFVLVRIGFVQFLSWVLPHKDAYAREKVLQGWYSSRAILPDEDTEIIWLGPDGREVIGRYDRQGHWCFANGERQWCVPLFWRYANKDNPDTCRNDAFSRWMARHTLERLPCEEGEV